MGNPLNILSGVGGAVSGLASGIASIFTTKATNKANMELAKYQNEANYKLWQEQNAYNTPAAQMQRYKDAGLNPLLIYGQGNSGNAGPAPRVETPTVDYRSIRFDNIMSGVNSALSAISQAKDIANKDAQNEYIQRQSEAQRILNMQRTLNLLRGSDEYDDYRYGREWSREMPRYNLEFSRQRSADLAYKNMYLNPAKLTLMKWQGKLSSQQYKQLQRMNDLNYNNSLIKYQMGVKNLAMLDLDSAIKRAVLTGKNIDNQYNKYISDYEQKHGYSFGTGFNERGQFNTFGTEGSTGLSWANSVMGVLGSLLGAGNTGVNAWKAFRMARRY